MRRNLNRIIGLSVRGQSYPEVFLVCQDVFDIVEKMLSANQTIGLLSRQPRFEFEEVLFILNMLGAPVHDACDGNYSSVDLWISEA